MANTEGFWLKDSRGARHLAVKTQPSRTHAALDGRTRTLDTLPSYRLANGERLNAKEDGSFEVVSTGERLVRE